jgi:hypothetical protein
MNKRLLKVAAYLGSQGLYKEAAQIKKLAEKEGVSVEEFVNKIKYYSRRIWYHGGPRGEAIIKNQLRDSIDWDSVWGIGNIGAGGKGRYVIWKVSTEGPQLPEGEVAFSSWRSEAVPGKFEIYDLEKGMLGKGLQKMFTVELDDPTVGDVTHPGTVEDATTWICQGKWENRLGFPGERFIGPRSGYMYGNDYDPSEAEGWKGGPSPSKISMKDLDPESRLPTSTRWKP